MEGQNQQIQAPQSPNQMPLVNTNSNGSKVILIILGTVAIAIIAIGSYILGTRQTQTPVQNIVQTTSIPTPTPDPTANWKTYVNTKVGFELKYRSNDLSQTPYYVVGPSGGQDIQTDGSEDRLVISFPGSDLDYANDFSLELFPYSGTLQDLLKFPTRLYGYSETEKPKAMQKNFKVSENDTLWIKRESEVSNIKFMYEIYLVGKGHAFIFHTSPNTTEKLIGQILSTLQFTE